MKISKNDLKNLIRRALKEETQKKQLNEVAIEAKVKGIDSVYDVLVSGGHIKSGDTLLLIDGQKQVFYLKKGSKDVTLKGKVSTAAKGFGNQLDSAQTPTGLMKVVGFGGKGAKTGTVLVGLQPTDLIVGPNQTSPRARQGHAAEVLTRAVVLAGLEEHNKNVKSRNIYVHGTNRENQLGQQASGGCVRVSSAHAIDLADRLMKVGDYVYIYTGVSITGESRQPDQTISGKQRLKSLLEQDQTATTGSEEKEYLVGGKPATEEEAFQVISKYPKEPNA